MKKTKKNEEKTEKKDEIKLELKECKLQLEQFKQQYLRALADYQNLEHRVSNERQNMREGIKREIIDKFIGVLDNLDQAEIFNQDPGLKIVGDHFRKVMSEMGVAEIDLLGSEYDPKFAEAIEAVEGKQDNIIVEVMQKGYSLNGQVIRHARVKVSKKKV